MYTTGMLQLKITTTYFYDLNIYICQLHISSNVLMLSVCVNKYVAKNSRL